MTFENYLMNNQEKYQGITREKFNEFYDQAKGHAKLIAQAIGLEVQSIDEDTADIRLQAMIHDGEVQEIGGLYWKTEAVDDARLAWEGIDSDSEQKEEENDEDF